MKKTPTPINDMFRMMKSKDANRLHAMMKALDWHKTRVVKETGIDHYVVKRFVDYKKVTVKTGARLAIAFIGGLIEKADKRGI